MSAFKLRLLFLLILTLLLFSPQLVFSDWNNDTTPPTVVVKVACGSGPEQTVTGSFDCGQTSATITITYSKASGLQEITHSVSSGSTYLTGTMDNNETGRSSIIIDGTTVCSRNTTPGPSSPYKYCYDSDPAKTSLTARYTIASGSGSYNLSATARDWRGNIENSTETVPLSISFVKYSIQGAVFVDTNKDGFKASYEFPYTASDSTIQVRIANPSPCSGSLVSAVGNNGTTTTINGTYNTGQNLLSGSYDICYTSLPAPEYRATLPQGGLPPALPPSRTVTVGPSATFINFGITNLNVWFQGKGGDMRLDGGFTDKLPSSVYASLPGAGGTPGIILTNGSADFGSGQASATYNWKIVNPSPSLTQPNFIRTSYNYLNSLAAQSGSTNLSDKCTISNCTLPADLPNGVYKVSKESGDLILNAWSPTGTGRNFVILIDGNLTIKGNIIIPTGFTAVFSASKDIKVNSAVGEANPSSTASDIEGFFSADKNFVIEGAGSCTDKRLNISGAIVANAGLSGGSFQNTRDLCADNTTYPALYIAERVDFILNAPAFVKRTPSIWRELPPGPLTAGPTPSPTPTPTPIPVKRIFITSTTYNGNLGGLDGGDSKCLTRANAANLCGITTPCATGTWKAWLSIGLNNGESPDTRFTKNIFGPYKLVDGTTLIANNWSDLINNGPRNKIEKDENGTTQSSRTAWTNTRKDGTYVEIDQDCSDWNVGVTVQGTQVFTGYIGNNTYSGDGRWTMNSTSGCGASLRLYCFEQ